MSRADRGEVWIVELGYVAKTRPCLVLSVPVLDTDRAIVTVIPHTTSPRGTRFEVTAPRPFLQRGVFDAQNPTSITQAKLVRKLGDLEGVQLAQVENAVRTWLGLRRDRAQ
jgi:mRNA interferase MazF